MDATHQPFASSARTAIPGEGKILHRQQLPLERVLVRVLLPPTMFVTLFAGPGVRPDAVE